ncbi:YkgJ family cysteine cluster protein [Thermodesulfobacteriota bacterium]
MFLDSAPSQEKRLDLKDSFNFMCRSGLACFNSCCSNKHLPLTPYDILRLKSSLHLHSDLFLDKYTNYRLDKESVFPIIAIKMKDGPDRACPFVSTSGCMVYANSPTACRLFPLGRVSGFGAGKRVSEEIFYLLDVKGCWGMDEPKAWTVEEWVKGQGLGQFIGMNDMMLDLLFHPKKESGRPLDSRQLQKVIVSCYNPDVFREFVFETKFLDFHDIDSNTRIRIKNDDMELLKLGIEYLKRSLFS